MNLPETYKLCLRIKLVDDSSVTIKVVKIDKRAITYTRLDGCNYYVFRDDSNEFRIWSYGEFSFNENHLRLPDSEHLTDETVCTYKFSTDGHRLNSLKRMYKSLQLWACDKHMFKTDASYKHETNVSIKDEFWFVY